MYTDNEGNTYHVDSDGTYYVIGADGVIYGYLQEVTITQLQNATSMLGISNFEWSCLQNYINRQGDMNISPDRFNSIVQSAGELIHTGFVTISGAQYTAKTFSFYNSSEYNAALGVATLYYDSSGSAVGFCDTYNFNVGNRTLAAEIATRIGAYIPGQAYNIYYGVHP